MVEVASSDFRPAFGVGDPREGRGDVAAFDFVPFVGDPLQRTVCIATHPLLGPREGRAEAATSDFVPALGVGDPPRMRGLRSNSILFLAPEKAVVRQPLPILSPRLASGTRENAGVT